MPGFQDLAVRLSELLEIPESEALAFVSRASPVFVVESIIGLPTTRVRGLVGIHCFGFESSQAVAVEFSHVQLLNPTSSGVIVHVDRVLLSTAALQFARVRRFDTPLTNLAPAIAFEDFRERGQPASVVREQANAAQLGTALGEVTLDANLEVVLEFNSLVLAPGQGVLVSPNLVNTQLAAWWFWREV